MKIRIAEKGWETYTGPLGDIEFVNGVSGDHVSQREANRLGAILRVEEIDKDGADQGQVSQNADYQKATKFSAPDVERFPRQTELDKATAEAKVEASAATPEGDNGAAVQSDQPTHEAPAEPAKVWTREELETVADQNGIKGLREIATPMGVISSSIGTMIDKILEAQSAKKGAQ